MKYTISHAEMVAKLYKKGDIQKQEMTAWDLEINHATIGIVGELGELFGGIEYSFAMNQSIDLANVLEELGDLEFFLENFRALMGWDREKDVLQCETICHQPTGPVRQAAHMLVYATDLMDHVKKAIIYRKPLNREAMLACMSKIEYILEVFYPNFNYTREQALEANMDKLAQRYSGFEYSDQKAQERADKPEEQGGKIIVPNQFVGNRIIKP